MSPSLRIFFAMYKTSPAHCSIANGIGFAQQQATNQHATMLNEPKNASNVKNVEKYKPRLIFWKNHPMLSSTKRACFTAISASNSMCYMCWSDHITWLPCSCDKVFPNVACYKKNWCNWKVGASSAYQNGVTTPFIALWIRNAKF